jgi:glycosyltransferase 2 family protein
MMKRLQSGVWAVARLAIGIGIVILLALNINKSSVLVVFRVPAAAVSEGAVYESRDDRTAQFTVLAVLQHGTELHALSGSKALRQLPPTGTLVLVKGTGHESLQWTGRTATPHGFHLLGETLFAARRNWPLIAGALLLFLACLCVITVRWRMILHAQELNLPWRETAAIFLIGQFFNSFLFGATGGDFVKAYYVAKETGHKKAEAVATVFIDRAVGLLALIVFAASVMVARLGFFLADPKTRYALVFMAVLIVAAAGGIGAMLLMPRILGRSRILERVLATQAGSTFRRAYDAFYLCLTHPALLAKTAFLSLANHVLLIVAMFCIGKALRINASFLDFLCLGPTINAIASVPVTPGGLGVRDYAAVIYLGVIGVPSAQALPLSLILYAMMLFWSLVGGLVFLFHTSGTRRSLRREWEEIEEQK